MTGKLKSDPNGKLLKPAVVVVERAEIEALLGRWFPNRGGPATLDGALAYLAATPEELREVQPGWWESNWKPVAAMLYFAAGNGDVTGMDETRAKGIWTYAIPDV